VSPTRPGSAGLIARLEWLRLLGIEDLPRAGGRAVTAPSAPSAAAPRPAGGAKAPAVQVGLFGGAEAPEPEAGPGGRGRRRGAASAEDASSPLATARAPEAKDAAEALALIRSEIGDCRRCRLCEQRTNIVFGVGDPGSRLMFIGEGPGVDEDRQGEPFVGRAGQLLTKIVESMGYRREEVYIANVVKCRPPENRTPQPDEIATCSPFLFQQAAAIRPRVIVCLGTPAAQTVLNTRATITHLRGTFREVNGIQVMPTFHPAYLLRNPAAKKEVWEDMKKVMALLKTEG
jgi:DNA polymerase